jgi:hypothetical protein
MKNCVTNVIKYYLMKDVLFILFKLKLPSLVSTERRIKRDLGLNRITPRPGFEPGSKAPEASRMSTTLPGHNLLYPFTPDANDRDIITKGW